MKKFSETLLEGKKVTIYHGDNHKTTKLLPKFMMQDSSNVQEGIGIYFGSLEVAKTYGNDIVTLEVDKSTFYNSQDFVEDIKSLNSNVTKILKELSKVDKEAMFYLISDYIEIYEVGDVEDYHMEELASYLAADEVRNFQIGLAQAFGVEKFVKVWNKILPKNNGTFHKPSGFYAVINPKLKVKKL